MRKSLNLAEDQIGIGGPHEWLWIVIIVIEVIPYGFFKALDAGE